MITLVPFNNSRSAKGVLEAFRFPGVTGTEMSAHSRSHSTVDQWSERWAIGHLTTGCQAVSHWQFLINQNVNKAVATD